MPSSKSHPTVLITGCSDGGLGAALCHEFRDRGYHVFATARNLSKATTLQQDGIELLQLDVTSSDSIEECAKRIRSTTGGSLDILVNNAGVLNIMPVLDASLMESRKMFDVNVWGTLAVTQAFGPMLVKSKGVVLNISSTAGVCPIAWQGLYSASKAAVLLMSETLRIEMEPLGVRVVTAMVGWVTTNIYQNGQPLHLPDTSYYRSIEQNIADVATGSAGILATEPVEETARNLVKDVLSGRSGQVWRGATAGSCRYSIKFMPRKSLENHVHVGRGLEKITPPGS